MLVAHPYGYGSFHGPPRQVSAERKKSSAAMKEKHAIPQPGRSWSALFSARQSPPTVEHKKSKPPRLHKPKPLSRDLNIAEVSTTRSKLPSHTAPSKPVDVPSRPPSSDGSSQPAHFGDDRNRQQKSATDIHDPTALSPAAIVMLAMTTIPKRSAIPRSVPSRSQHQKMSMDELVAEWKDLDKTKGGIACSPKMETLLSTLEEDDISPESPANESLLSPSFTSRSASSDSVPSLASTSRATSTASSPCSVIRRSLSHDRIKSSPRSVEHGDHPLLDQIDSESYDDLPEATHEMQVRQSLKSAQDKPSKRNLAAKRQPSNLAQISSFKSNLTASLTALRSAARSFSNFAAPAIVPDDHLHRGLLQQQYRPEMRPQPIQGTPTPELRRYLNPPQHLAPGDFHLHNTHLDHTDLESLAAKAALLNIYGRGNPDNPAEAHVIALQPFTRAGKPSLTTAENIPKQIPRKHNKSTSSARIPSPPPPFSTEAGRALLACSDPTQAAAAAAMQPRPRREPRDNCDFLRVCVLEMNMRRCGKVDGPVSMSGRRSWCLPPRDNREHVTRDVCSTDGGEEEEEEEEEEGSFEGVCEVKRRKVPRRWVGESYE